MKITKWSPDTCKCEIDYEWDESVLQGQRVHIINKMVRICDAHAVYTDKKQCFNAIVKENQKKNNVLGYVLENFPVLVENKMDENGNISKSLKPGINYVWSFDADRNLIVDFKGVSPDVKKLIQEAILFI